LSSRDDSPLASDTLNELVKALSEEDSTKYADLLRTAELSADDFESCCSWSSESYTRNCVIDNEDFELILLCWQPGQLTPIHDHGGEECWVKIIEGEFKETVYKEDDAGTLEIARTTESKANDITYMVDFMGFHSLENLSKKKSLSLHLYAKPIRSCQVFDEETGELTNKDLTYDTIA